MTLAEKIAQESGTLNPGAQQQVLDFIAFLKMKEQATLEADMDAVIADNLHAWEELAK